MSPALALHCALIIAHSQIAADERDDSSSSDSDLDSDSDSSSEDDEEDIVLYPSDHFGLYGVLRVPDSC